MQMSAMDTSSILQLNLPRTPPDLEKFCAVGGTALLGDFRRVISGTAPISYFQFVSLCEFVEAVVLHERVVLVGSLQNEQDAAFLREVNAALGPYVVTALPDHKFEACINTPDVSAGLRHLIESVFASKHLSLTPRVLNEKVRPSRMGEDHKARLIEGYRSALERQGETWHLNKQAYRQLLLSELSQSFSDDSVKFSAFYLLRALLHAAIALTIDGTLVADGTRRVMKSFILASTERTPVTLGKLLYDLMNAAYATVVQPHRKLDYPQVPIATQFVLLNAKSRGDILGQLARAREAFRSYRTFTLKEHEILLDPSLSAEKLTRHRLELIMGSGDYLVAVVGKLGNGNLAPSHFLRKLLRRSIDVVAGVPKVKSQEGSSFGLEAEVDAKALLLLTRNTAGAVHEQRFENRFRPLLEALDAVSARRSLATEIQRILPVEPFDWTPFDQAFYTGYLPLLA
jgi:hypothetical protein